MKIKGIIKDVRIILEDIKYRNITAKLLENLVTTCTDAGVKRKDAVFVCHPKTLKYLKRKLLKNNDKGIKMIEEKACGIEEIFLVDTAHAFTKDINGEYKKLY